MAPPVQSPGFVSLSSLYFCCQSCAASLASSSRLRCLHIKAAAPSNASPNGTPTPTPTATGSLDEDDELGHVVRFGELTVVVEGAAVDVTVIKDGSPATVDVGADETVAVAV